MITENLQTLKIHKLSKAQYERELKAGKLDENAIYLTPDDDDLSVYLRKDQIDSALSSTSINPVQNKVINSALNTAASAISSNTSAISNHSSAINTLQTKIDGITEITSAEIKSLFSA